MHLSICASKLVKDEQEAREYVKKFVDQIELDPNLAITASITTLLARKIPINPPIGEAIEVPQKLPPG
jgi:hypothetical protein